MIDEPSANRDASPADSPAPEIPTLDYQPNPDADDLDQVNWFAYIAVAVVLVSLAVALIGMGVVLSMVIRYFQGIMG